MSMRNSFLKTAVASMICACSMFGFVSPAVAVSYTSSVVNGNRMYSINSVTYHVYESDKSTRATDLKTNQPAVLTTSWNGSDDVAMSGTVELKAGTYYLAEVTPGDGLKNNNPVADKNKWIQVEVEAGLESSAKVANAEDDPIYVEGPGIYKIDRVTGTTPQGNATLAGAVIRVTYYDELDVTIDNYESKTAKNTWYFETTEDGSIDFSTADSVSYEGAESDPFYMVDSQRVFLLGSYVMEEVAPPTGYLLPTEKADRVRVINCDENTEHTAATPDFNTEMTKDENKIKEDPIRAQARLDKADVSYAKSTTHAEKAKKTGQGNTDLTQAEFTFYNISTHPVTRLDDSVVPVATDASNPNDESAMFTIQCKLSEASHVIAETARRALPYGSYKVIETKAAKGYKKLPKDALPVLVVTEDDKWYEIGRTYNEWHSVLDTDF